MTTVVIHGTLANGASWYKSSWSGHGFLAGLQQGMLAETGTEDIWTVNGADVGAIPDLGIFEWSGSHEGSGRGFAAQQLAKYLSRLCEYTSEPIRVIAHSHGCNVLKLATALPEIADHVFIEKAVFLACPHFSEAGTNPEKMANWQDKFSFKKLAEHGRAAPRLFRYAMNPERFGRILNMYSEQDAVQVKLAQLFGSTLPPMTGTMWNNFKAGMTTGGMEYPTSTRTDLDPNTNGLYEDLALHISGRGSGTTAHSALHGFNAGRFCGVWLNSRATSQEMVDNAGPPVLSFDDLGA